MRLFKQYATTPRVTQIINQDNAETIYWSSSNIDTNSIIQSEDSTPNNADKQSIIMSLYSSGLFNDKFGNISTETKRQIADAFEIKNFVFEESLSDIQKQKAKQENQLLENIEQPCEIDDHAIHIEEHSKYLLTNNLNKKDKDILLAHINQHKNLTK